MKSFLNEDMQAVNFSESELLSLEWINNYVDLKIRIEWSGQLTDGQILVHSFSYFYCKFVTNLKINFAFAEEKMGNVSISDILIENLNGRQRIHLDFLFQPTGFIEFYCDDVQFLIE